MNRPVLQGRPATADDIAEFYPTLTASTRAWVCELNGKAEGIIGIALLRPVACLFSVFRDVLKPYLRHPTVLRLIKKAEAAVKATKAPVWAIAQPDMPTAPKVLERLGFEHIGELAGDAIYAWAPGRTA